MYPWISKIRYLTTHICSLYLTDYLHAKAARLTIQSIEKTGRHKRFRSIRQTNRPSSDAPIMPIDVASAWQIFIPRLNGRSSDESSMRETGAFVAERYLITASQFQRRASLFPSDVREKHRACFTFARSFLNVRSPSVIRFRPRGKKINVA